MLVDSLRCHRIRWLLGRAGLAAIPLPDVGTQHLAGVNVVAVGAVSPGDAIAAIAVALTAGSFGRIRRIEPDAPDARVAVGRLLSGAGPEESEFRASRREKAFVQSATVELR